MFNPLSTVAIALFLTSPLQAESEFCLHAVDTGNQNATPIRCVPGNSDPLELKNNADIKSTLNLFGLDPAMIEFKGCEGLGFRISDIPSSDGEKYLISYSSNANEKAIAAVIHELGHAVQIRSYGGYVNLQNKYSSVQIELGADYLTGVAFDLVLKNKDLKDFEQNIELAGFYIPSTIEHGNPTKRDQAFRIGVFGQSKNKSIFEIHQNFQDNLYGAIY